MLILPSAGSRAGFMGLFIGLVYSALFLSRARIADLIRPVTGKFKMIALVFVAAMLLVACYNFRPASVKGRLLVWKISCEAIVDRPFWGWGTNSFKKVYPEYQIKYFSSRSSDANEQLLSDEVNTGFSEPVQVTFEWGIFGLAIVGLLYYNAFKTSGIKTLQEGGLQAGARGALLSFGVFSLFSYPFSLPEMSLYFFVYLALQTSLMERSAIQHDYVRRTAPLPIMVTVIFIVSNLVMMSELCNAYRQWQIALTKTALGDRSADEIYKQIYPKLHRDEFFLSDYAYVCYAQGDYKKCIEVLIAGETTRYYDLTLLGECFQKTGHLDRATGYYRKAYFLLPHRFYPVYRMMNISRIAKDSLQMIKLARVIVRKQIKIASPEVMMMIMEAKQVLKSVHNVPRQNDLITTGDIIR